MLGGTGSVFAPFVGSIAFEFVKNYALKFSPQHLAADLGVFLLLVIYFQPQGLWHSPYALAGEATMAAAMIDVQNVSRAFDMLRAVDDVSLSVGEGETVGIIGTNGSGKTTLLNLITGYLQPTSGRIVFQGADITGLGPRRITTLGVARSFQVPQLYTGLTVLDNVLIAIAAHSGRGADFWTPMYRRDCLTKADERPRRGSVCAIRRR